ncbi:MAG: hypothetical protein QMB40_12535 [Aeromonadaceae bacterium]
MMLKWSLLGVVLLLGVGACSEMKSAGRTVGHTTRDVTRTIGHTTRDVTKQIGHGTRDTVTSVKDGWEEAE